MVHGVAKSSTRLGDFHFLPLHSCKVSCELSHLCLELINIVFLADYPLVPEI